MIEKLDPNDARPSVLIAKVNELIDKINQLEMDYAASKENDEPRNEGLFIE
jgi:uncharacterized protein YdcH (DUF465 family)